MRAVFLLFFICHLTLADDYYEYEDQYYEESDNTVLGYLFKEATKQATKHVTKQLVTSKEVTGGHLEDNYYYADTEYEEEPLQEASNGLSNHQNIKNKDSHVSSSGSIADDPVFNLILVFSVLALFFHAFFTPYGKVTIGRKRR